MSNRPVDGRSSETDFHSNDMNNNKYMTRSSGYFLCLFIVYLLTLSQTQQQAVSSNRSINVINDNDLEIIWKEEVDP
jgi:hypothetical protein